MDARALKDKATEFFSKGKFAKAAEAYELYCKADPKDLQARLRMGDAWAKSGKKDRAIVAYHAAAEGFAKDGFLPRAIAASKLVLELDPSHKGVAQMLADLYARKSGSTRPSTARTIGAKPEPAVPTPEVKPEPSPMNRPDAIEVAIEDSGSVEVAIDVDAPVVGVPVPIPPKPSAPIEIDLGAPTTGEVEIPIGEASSRLPAPGELPAELEVEVSAEAAAPIQGVSLELDVPLDPSPLPSLELSKPVEEIESIDPEPSIDPPARVVSAPAPIEVLESIDPEPSIDPPARVAAAPAPIEVLESIDPEPSIDPPVRVVSAVAPIEVLESIDPEPSIDPPARVASAPAPIEVLDEPVVLTKKRVEPLAEVEPVPAASSPSRPDLTPPGLRPKKPGEVPQSSPSARIWLPPSFQPAAATSQPEGPVETDAAPGPRAGAKTELERSLEVFSQFDVDVPTAPPAPRPAPPPPALPVASFTELELEGDSLLQAVEAAATIATGIPHSSASISLRGEELMEAPDEIKPEAGQLPKIPLFSDLPEDAFIALFERCPLRRAEPGDRIIEQGSQGTSFFVICAGKVRVLRTDGDATRELATLDEGAFFGEMALLSDAPRSASVEAASEDTQLLEIPAIVLTDLSTQYPTVATALKKFCRQRLLSNLMSSAALFKPFTKTERRDLVQRFRARDANPGEVLIREGQPSDGLYVVLTGEVAVVVGARQVATLKEGQVFGEMSLLTRSPTSATVKTTRRTSYLRLPKEDFDHLIMSHPQILEQVAELTDERRKQNAALGARPDATSSMV